MGRIMLPGARVSWNQTHSSGMMWWLKGQWEASDRSQKGAMIPVPEFVPCKLGNTNLNLKQALAFKGGLKESIPGFCFDLLCPSLLKV